MPDTAQRLAGPVQLTAAAVTYYTTPAATTTVIRQIIFTNDAAVVRTVRVSIGVDASGTRIVKDLPIPPGVPQIISGFLVLETGDILQAYADAGAAVNFTVSGVEIT